MLYTDNLEEIIFHRHEIHNSDELIVLSGYLGPRPVGRLRELTELRCRVIYGMYGSEGVKNSLHNALTRIQNNTPNVDIFYSRLPVHSKCYVWRRNGEIIHALIGSANFSVNGLTTPFREVLAETTFDTFTPLNQYIHHVLNNCISCLEVTEEAIPPKNTSTHCLMTLVKNDGEVQNTAGLNWGQNPRNHTRPNDAYIPIRTYHIRDYPVLFPPKQENPLNSDGRGRIYRHNDSIEILWDDGLIMTGLLEGSQPINGDRYPKQISSFPRKSELGEYIRLRIGVPSGQPVRRHHLETYGRTDIEVSLLEPGIYKFDFSV